MEKKEKTVRTNRVGLQTVEDVIKKVKLDQVLRNIFPARNNIMINVTDLETGKIIMEKEINESVNSKKYYNTLCLVSKMVDDTKLKVVGECKVNEVKTIRKHLALVPTPNIDSEKVTADFSMLVEVSVEKVAELIADYKAKIAIEESNKKEVENKYKNILKLNTDEIYAYERIKYILENQDYFSINTAKFSQTIDSTEYSKIDIIKCFTHALRDCKMKFENREINVDFMNEKDCNDVTAISLMKSLRNSVANQLQFDFIKLNGFSVDINVTLKEINNVVEHTMVLQPKYKNNYYNKLMFNIANLLKISKQVTLLTDRGHEYTACKEMFRTGILETYTNENVNIENNLFVIYICNCKELRLITKSGVTIDLCKN